MCEQEKAGIQGKEESGDESVKVLITGMTSRMTAFSRELGFPSLLARAIKDQGHEVTMHVEHSGVERYDAVIVGIASPLSPSSTYLVPAAQTIDEASRSRKLAAILVDEHDLNKIGHGCASLLRKPVRLDRSFYRSRPGTDTYISNESVRSTVLSVVERMSLWSWDTIVWPAHPWGEGKFPQKGSAQAIGIDLSATLHSLIETRIADRPPFHSLDLKKAVWIAETTYFENAKFDPSITRPFFEVSLGDKTVASVLDRFLVAYGVIHGNSEWPGWWTPNLALARAASTLFVPHPDEGSLMGGPYYLLPSSVEELDGADYESLTASQGKHYEEDLCLPSSKLEATLTGVLGRTGS